MGLAIPTAAELESVLKGVFPDEIIETLRRESVLHLDDATVHLLSKQLPMPEVGGPVLALAHDPTSLQSLIDVPWVTDVVYVPRTQDDLEAYLSMYPESAAVSLQPQQIAVPQLTDAYESGRKWFEERYEVIAKGAFSSNSKVTHLGNLAERVCRYCGEKEPNVTFRNKAHAFPEQIGNKALIDWLECDSCNEHFSKWVEDDFAKWTLPMRSMGRVNGKGLPSLKSSDKLLRVDAESSKQLKIHLPAEDPRHQLNVDTNTVTLRLERQPYVPMGVFKCMVKMALAVMPDTEADLCRHLKQWVLQENHTFESYRYKPLNIFAQYIPGPLANDRFQFTLLRRQPERNDCPFMVFVLQFSNVMYQIALPMHNEDRVLIDAGKFDLSFFPHSGGSKDHEDSYGPTVRRILDMSGTEIVRGEHEPMNFHFDKLVELPVSPRM